MQKTLKDLKRDYERGVVTTTLAKNGGDHHKTSQALGITKRALEKILVRHHLLKRRFTKQLPIPPVSMSPEQDSQDLYGKGDSND